MTDFKDAQATQVLALLEQIRRVNDMIDRQKGREFAALHIEQYERQKAQFLEELKTVLAHFSIEADLRAVAA